MREEEVKEKLVEILKGLDINCIIDAGGSKCEEECRYANVDFSICCEERVADGLIQSGVTIATDTNAGDKWVSVDERLPEETDSIFAKFYGTKKWDSAMCRKSSNDVLVCIEYEDGSRKVGVAHTRDGKWNLRSVWKMKITHWCPYPEPPKGVQ